MDYSRSTGLDFTNEYLVELPDLFALAFYFSIFYCIV